MRHRRGEVPEQGVVAAIHDQIMGYVGRETPYRFHENFAASKVGFVGWCYKRNSIHWAIPRKFCPPEPERPAA